MDYKSLFPDLKKRKEDFKKISYNHPNMIPVIVQPNAEEKAHTLPNSKFLVPKAYTFQEFQYNIRKKFKLGNKAAMFFIIGEKQVPSMERCMLDLYKEFKDLDGFLYINYSIENNYGAH